MTSTSMIKIPANIREKYGIKEEDRAVFIETDRSLVLLRVPPLKELSAAAEPTKMS